MPGLAAGVSTCASDRSMGMLQWSRPWAIAQNYTQNTRQLEREQAWSQRHLLANAVQSALCKVPAEALENYLHTGARCLIGMQHQYILIQAGLRNPTGVKMCCKHASRMLYEFFERPPCLVGSIDAPHLVPDRTDQECTATAL